MVLYRSGNLGLGSSVKDLADALQVHLFAAGWVLHDDGLTSQGDASGYRVYALPGKGDQNGLVKLDFDGTQMGFSAVHRFVNGAADYQSEVYTRPVDLANGSNYFLSVGDDHLAILLETPAGIADIVVVGVADPDTVSPAYAGQGLDVPRGFVAAPVSNVFSVAQYLAATGVAAAGNVYQYIAGDFNPSNFERNFKLTFEYNQSDTRDLIDYDGSENRFNIFNQIYQPTASLYSFDFDTSKTRATYAPFVAWAALPGCYLTTADAGDRVAVLAADRDSFYGNTSVLKLAADISDGDTSLNLIGDLSDLPAPGSLLLGAEWITYSSVTGQTVSGLARGRYGSVATAHIATAPAFQDDFDRADTDNDLGADYTLSGVSAQTKIDIDSNAVAVFKDTGNSYRYPHALIGASADHQDALISAVVDFAQIGSSLDEAHLYLQFVDDDNWLRLEIDSNGPAIIHKVSGTEKTVETAFFSPPAGAFTLALRVQGRQAVGLVNGQPIVGGVLQDDPQPGKGAFGAQLYSSLARIVFDDLSYNRYPADRTVYKGLWYIKAGKAMIFAGADKP